MKKLIIIIQFIFIISVLFSQIPPDTLWTRTFSADEDLNGKSVIQTSDDGYMILCDTFDNIGNGDIYLIKTDSEGNEEWRQVFGVENEERAISMVRTADDCYVLLGTTKQMTSTTDATLIKVDNSGNQLWMNNYGSMGDAWVTDLINTDDGGFAFCGNYFDQGWLVKTDAEGIEEWSQTYNSEGVDRWFNSVIQRGSGGFLAAGEILYDFSYTNIWLVGTDSAGNITAIGQTINPGVWEQIYDIEQLENNSYLLAGRTRIQNLGDWEGLYMNVEPDIASYNWRLQYAGEFSSGFSKTIIASDSYNFLGYTIASPPDFNTDLLLVNTDTAGNVVWESSWGGDDDEFENDMLILNNGDLVILADTYSYGSDGRNLWLLYLSTETEVNNELSVPYYLLSNFPNPFNPTTKISYSLKENAKVSLNIYNIKGQKVKQLVSDQLSVGQHSVAWDGRDNNGKLVSSGIYFYKLKAGDYQKVKKMILLK